MIASQAMTASVGEKRKRPDGMVFEEPPVIPCTVEELNHVLDKWIGTEWLDHSPCPGHQRRKKGRIPCFAGFITMSSTPPRIDGPFADSFTRNYEKEL